LPSYPGASPINLADPNLRMIDPRSSPQPALPAGQTVRPAMRAP
jgi:hypothetical protein